MPFKGRERSGGYHASRPIILQQEYQGYMCKKAQKRQSLIVSLSDENHRQLAEIERQQEEVEQEFEERKTGRVARCASAQPPVMTLLPVPLLLFRAEGHSE